jgi:periplasmic protein TonB
MILVMKINFDIDIGNDKVPQLPVKIKQKNSYLFTLLSVFLHLCLIVLLFSSAFFSKNIMIDNGDNSIKAIMIDLSQLTAPKQLLVENIPEIKGARDSERIDNKLIEKPIIETEIVKEKNLEPITEKKPEKLVDILKKEVTIKQETKPKPNPKQKLSQKESLPQVKQEIISNKIKENLSVAPSIGNNHQYSKTPSAIIRNQPEYPRRALDLRLEGYVIVMFDVNSNGRVENIRILKAKPNNIFNLSVINAMKTWKYQPIITKNLKTKIIFNRDKSIQLDNS